MKDKNAKTITTRRKFLLQTLFFSNSSLTDISQGLHSTKSQELVNNNQPDLSTVTILTIQIQMQYDRIISIDIDQLANLYSVILR